MVASKNLTLGVKVQILSGHQYGVSSLSGKASRCEREEQGSSPGVHPTRNIVQLERTLGYGPKDASSSLAISTKHAIIFYK